MRYYKLSLNYSKITYMLINNNLSQLWNFKEKVNGYEIKRTAYTK